MEERGLSVASNRDVWEGIMSVLPGRWLLSLRATGRDGRELAGSIIKRRFVFSERARRRLGEPLGDDVLCLLNDLDDENTKKKKKIETLGDLWLGGAPFDAEVPEVVQLANCCALEGTQYRGDVQVPRALLLLEVLCTLTTPGGYAELTAMKNCCVILAGLMELCAATSTTFLDAEPCVEAFVDRALLWQPDGVANLGDIDVLHRCARQLTPTTPDEWDTVIDPMFYCLQDDHLLSVDGDPGCAVIERRKRTNHRLRTVVGLVARAGLRLSADQRAALVAREFGKRAFLNADYDEASRYYRSAATLAPRDAVYTANLALCCLKQKAYFAAVSYADDALTVDPTNIKAIHRKAMAFLALGHTIHEDPSQVTEALNDAGTSPALDPLRRQWHAACLKPGTKEDAGRAYAAVNDCCPHCCPREMACRALWFMDQASKDAKLTGPLLVAVRNGCIGHVATMTLNQLAGVECVARSRLHCDDHHYLAKAAEYFHTAALSCRDDPSLDHEKRCLASASYFSHATFYSFLAWQCTRPDNGEQSVAAQLLIQRSVEAYDFLIPNDIGWKRSDHQFWASLLWRLAPPDIAQLLDECWQLPPPSIVNSGFVEVPGAEYILQGGPPPNWLGVPPYNHFFT